MITLDNTDSLEAGASVDAVVDCTVHGLIGSTFTNLYSGQLSDTDPTSIYTATAAISIISVTMVNTHSSAVEVNLYLDPANAGNPRRMIPKDLSLGIGFSLQFDGQRCTVMDASGRVLSLKEYADHATSHRTGESDDLLSAPGAIGGTTPAAIAGTTGVFSSTLSGRLEPLTITTSASLTVTQCSGVAINNFGQAAAITPVLPTCVAGLHGKINILTTGYAFHLDVQAADISYLDGALLDAGDKISNATPAMDDELYFEAVLKTGSGYRWKFTGGTGNWIDGGV